MVNTKVQKLAKDVHAIDCSKEVALLLRLSKEARKAAQVCVCVCLCVSVYLCVRLCLVVRKWLS